MHKVTQRTKPGKKTSANPSNLFYQCLKTFVPFVVQKMKQKTNNIMKTYPKQNILTQYKKLCFYVFKKIKFNTKDTKESHLKLNCYTELSLYWRRKYRSAFLVHGVSQRKHKVTQSKASQTQTKSMTLCV
jgi:hypothetical protein